jgi:hypothetical protein
LLLAFATRTLAASELLLLLLKGCAALVEGWLENVCSLASLIVSLDFVLVASCPLHSPHTKHVQNYSWLGFNLQYQSETKLFVVWKNKVRDLTAPKGNAINGILCS